MNRKHVVLIGVAALLIAAVFGGYWLGASSSHAPMDDSSAMPESVSKILYYRNPMGLPDTSPVPKKDSMGMDYVPVYAGDETVSGQLSISLDKVQKLGVKYEAAAMRVLDKSIRATGRIEIDEGNIYTIAPKFDGWVDRLYVNTTGESVRKGQALFDVYSPELISALHEYALAVKGEAALSEAGQDARDSMRRLAESSRMRLKNWDIPDDQVSELSSEEAKRNITFRSPVTGIVLDKPAEQGMRFMPGEVLYRIADLTSVWVVAEVNEQDVVAIRLGSMTRIKVDAYPEKDFHGRISFIYPTLDPVTRTVKVRVSIANPKGLLKPAMFASVNILDNQDERVLSIPVSAVIDSGKRQVALVQLAEGRFEPRDIRVGRRGGQYVEVLDGIDAGEQVVTSANFLIDSESNLNAALGGLSRDSGKSSGYRSMPVGHKVHGRLEEIFEDGSLSITHEPIKALGWPEMTMDFEVANTSLIKGVEAGSMIDFEIVEREPGVWVITSMKAVSMKHEGH